MPLQNKKHPFNTVLKGLESSCFSPPVGVQDQGDKRLEGPVPIAQVAGQVCDVHPEKVDQKVGCDDLSRGFSG